MYYFGGIFKDSCPRPRSPNPLCTTTRTSPVPSRYGWGWYRKGHKERVNRHKKYYSPICIITTGPKRRDKVVYWPGFFPPHPWRLNIGSTCLRHPLDVWVVNVDRRPRPVRTLNSGRGHPDRDWGQSQSQLDLPSCGSTTTSYPP